MLGQRHKFNVDLLSYFLDAKLKHCREMKLKTKCLQLYHRAFKIWAPSYGLNLCSRTVIAVEGVKGQKKIWKTIWPHVYHLALNNKPKMPSVNFQNLGHFPSGLGSRVRCRNGFVNWWWVEEVSITKKQPQLTVPRHFWGCKWSARDPVKRVKSASFESEQDQLRVVCEVRVQQRSSPCCWVGLRRVLQ